MFSIIQVLGLALFFLINSDKNLRYLNPHKMNKHKIYTKSICKTSHVMKPWIKRSQRRTLSVSLELLPDSKHAATIPTASQSQTSQFNFNGFLFLRIPAECRVISIKQN